MARLPAQDRRKFGPLGWNIRYDFTDGDLNVSLAQLQEYLDKCGRGGERCEGPSRGECDVVMPRVPSWQRLLSSPRGSSSARPPPPLALPRYEEVPFKVLRFLFTEINYGGRVTDDKDRRLINNLITSFCGPELLAPGYAFSPSGTYTVPDAAAAGVRDHLELLRGLPIVPRPEIFGLHENADITCDQVRSWMTRHAHAPRQAPHTRTRAGWRAGQAGRKPAVRTCAPSEPHPRPPPTPNRNPCQNETYDMCATLLALQPRVASGGGSSQEEVIGALAADILARLPPPFDVEAVAERYPTTYRESMNTVLTQECIRCAGPGPAPGGGLACVTARAGTARRPAALLPSPPLMSPHLRSCPSPSPPPRSYNALLGCMASSLGETLKALKGLVVMSPELEKVAYAMYDNQVRRGGRPDGEGQNA